MNCKKEKNNIGFLRFGRIKKDFLITNENGEFLFLKPDQFKKFLGKKLGENSELYKKLKKKNFIIQENKDIPAMAEKYRQKNFFLFKGPSLHIIITTLRCDHKCIYCQASSRGMEEKKYDMSIPIAKKTIDVIFSSPLPSLSIELQGGEPLANWRTVKFIIEYSQKKSEKTKKRLTISLVSNFSLMDEKKYDFLVKNKVSLCTSLDGPEELHNKNRICKAKNSYQNTVKWIKRNEKISALTTISRNSLNYPKEIIEEYLKWGLKEIHLRPLSYLGLSQKMRKIIGYSAEEFFEFWKKAMDNIIKNNIKGKKIKERGTKIILQKILNPQDPDFLDLRSPCGAGTGQLLYNYDGKVYTCDEGRMTGDDTFLIGNVKKDNYEKIVLHPTVKAVCIASLLENLPCDQCVYKPYCGVCPVQNYVLYKNIFPQLANSERCILQKKIFQYIFEGLRDKKIEKIFKSWIKKWG
jgi:His-Xaa-Ser system radical SAM maturase HxsB